jgi:hypothetical protein
MRILALLHDRNLLPDLVLGAADPGGERHVLRVAWEVGDALLAEEVNLLRTLVGALDGLDRYQPAVVVGTLVDGLANGAVLALADDVSENVGVDHLPAQFVSPPSKLLADDKLFILGGCEGRRRHCLRGSRHRARMGRGRSRRRRLSGEGEIGTGPGGGSCGGNAFYILPRRAL